ncbi:MAG: hypothetical protein CML17_02010 [Pusillimonas sp.]|nr:hypothetical protein [Pusillimonas sp.]|tara:strand:+ start:140 stop:343 length:204 start_codon:yes stop_codon:yes gene_type:complete
MSIDIIGDTIYYMNKPVADIRDDVMPSFRDKFEDELVGEDNERTRKAKQSAYNELAKAVDCALNDYA